MRASSFALLAVASITVAQPARLSVADLSPLDRQKEHFYSAISGTGSIAATWSISPLSAPSGRDRTLTLTISNAANPHELTAPPLGEMPEFQRLFSVITLNPSPKPSPDTLRVEIRYTVRPRIEGQFQIPELKYRFARRSGGQTQFQMTYAEAVPFTVTKPVVPSADPRPLDGPPAFFGLREDRFMQSGGPGCVWWLGLIGGAGVIGLTWIAGWRWLYPDAVRLFRIRRNRAVRMALDRLRAAHRHSDPAAETADSLRTYLVGRHGVPHAARTPHEIATALRAIDFPEDRIAVTEQLLREADAVRFGGRGQASITPGKVVALIEQWEGVRG